MTFLGTLWSEAFQLAFHAEFNMEAKNQLVGGGII